MELAKNTRGGAGWSISSTIANVVTAVDGVTNINGFDKHFFHVSSIVSVDALDSVALIVFNLHIANTCVVFLFFIREVVVSFFFDFLAGRNMAGDVFIPFSATGRMFVAEEVVVHVFEFFPVFVEFDTIIVDGTLIKRHGTEAAFVDVELVHDDTNFTTTTAFDLGAAEEDLSHDGGFANMSEATGGVFD